MFSTLPQSVCWESWEAWESKRVEREDHDARELPQEAITTTDTREEDTSDSEMSWLAVDDSPRARRLKLDTAQHGMTSPSGAATDQMVHLRGVKLKAQKTLHDMRRRKGGEKNRHLPDLLDDISSVLQTHQTRETDGKFGRSDLH